MENSTDASSNGLEELLESHISKLADKLSLPYTLEEIEAELASLNDLVYTFKRRDELLEKLLDGATTEYKREQIREALKAQRMRVAENRAETERIHRRSRALLERSMQLILRAQRDINKKAHKHAGYALELCALCNGLGGSTENPCAPCNGKGSVLVHQPSLKCPRCKGTGKPPVNDQLTYSTLCIICRGSGWVMTHD